MIQSAIVQNLVRTRTSGSSDIFVARQPIFTPEKKVFAYELLFRSGLSSVLGIQDGDQATSSVLANSFLLIGMENLTRGKQAFVNFTRNLLIRGAATSFSRNIMAVEILEDVNLDQELLDACRQLRRQGYLIALDDFVYRPELAPLLEIADIIKVDFLSTPRDECERLVKLLSNGHIRFLAEKVETAEDFQMALDYGYSLIQGYFFARPDVVQGKDIPSFKLNTLNAIYEIHQPQINLNNLEQIISMDISLSFKLLRLLNSAHFGLPSRVGSIRQALIMLGNSGIRKWASLLALTTLGDEQPTELTILSAVRARFCELLADRTHLREHKSDVYLMGLFSLVDIFMDQPMNTILSGLPVSEAVKDALLEKPGQITDLFQLVLAYEAADWKRISELSEQFSLTTAAVCECYLDALEWSNRVFFQP